MPQKTSTAPDLQQEIRRLIVDSYLSNGQADTLRDDADLLTVLDSLQVLRMIMHLESAYGIKVENRELSPENLGTIERLAAFIERKRA
jgi:acyl carrier protein